MECTRNNPKIGQAVSAGLFINTEIREFDIPIKKKTKKKVNLR